MNYKKSILQVDPVMNIDVKVLNKRLSHQNQQIHQKIIPYNQVLSVPGFTRMIQHSKNKEISKTDWTGRTKMQDKDTSLENC